MKKRIIFVLAFLLFVFANTYADPTFYYTDYGSGYVSIEACNGRVKNDQTLGNLVDFMKQNISIDKATRSVSYINQLTKLEWALFWEAYYGQYKIIPNEIYCAYIIRDDWMYDSMYLSKTIYFYTDNKGKTYWQGLEIRKNYY